MKCVSRSFAHLAAAVLAAFLVACAPEPKPQFPEITFDHLSPIRLDVADVEFVEAYEPPYAAPNVEHLFPVQPAAAVKRWTKYRLEPVGVTRRARLTLVNAAVVETALEPRTGLTGLFYSDQSERYDGIIEVRVEILDDRGIPEAHARAVAKRSRTVGEDATINQRERVWFDLTEALLKDLDAEIEKTIRNYLAIYVR